MLLCQPQIAQIKSLCALRGISTQQDFVQNMLGNLALPRVISRLRVRQQLIGVKSVHPFLQAGALFERAIMNLQLGGFHRRSLCVLLQQTIHIGDFFRASLA